MPPASTRVQPQAVCRAFSCTVLHQQLIACGSGHELHQPIKTEKNGSGEQDALPLRSFLAGYGRGSAAPHDAEVAGGSRGGGACTFGCLGTNLP